MAKFQGKALLPTQFVTRYMLPSLLSSTEYWHMIPQQIRKYFIPHNPDKDIPSARFPFGSMRSATFGAAHAASGERTVICV